MMDALLLSNGYDITAPTGPPPGPASPPLLGSSFSGSTPAPWLPPATGQQQQEAVAEAGCTAAGGALCPPPAAALSSTAEYELLSNSTKQALHQVGGGWVLWDSDSEPSMSCCGARHLHAAGPRLARAASLALRVAPACCYYAYETHRPHWMLLLQTAALVATLGDEDMPSGSQRSSGSLVTSQAPQLELAAVASSTASPLHTRPLETLAAAPSALRTSPRCG